MRLFSTSSSHKGSPTPSEQEKTEAPSQNHHVPQDQDGQPYNNDTDDLPPSCPPHTTERKLLTRIDIHVIPCLCILYILAFLDRVNISNANVFGLADELGLVGNEYNTALVIFFVPYILFEIPSNILLKKFKPNVWLSLNMFLFGFVTIMQGIVRNYSGLLATRFFLGVFETGMFPGCFYLIGMWYRRHEAQKRYSFFFSSTTLAGAFGGLLAAAIWKMDGVANYAGWRWIFILEGALTVAVSILFFFILPTFPEQANWLSEDEKHYVAARLQIDQGRSAVERPIALKDVGKVFKDYKVIVAGIMYFGLIVPAYGYAYFAPGIIRTYGYSAIQTQLHSVPPWAAAFGFAMLIATLSDLSKHRFLYIFFCTCVAMTGFAILISTQDNTTVQYAALFLVTMGTYAAMPIIVCWFNLNLGGHSRRAVGSAFQVGFGNIGGIIAVFAFLPDDAPRYVTGYAICIAFTILSIAFCAVYGVGCWRENWLRERGGGQEEGVTGEEKMELGDMAPGYRYLL